MLVCECMRVLLAYYAVEVVVPEQHGAVGTRWGVEEEDQRVHAVMLPTHIGHVLTNHSLLYCWESALHAFWREREDTTLLFDFLSQIEGQTERQRERG